MSTLADRREERDRKNNNHTVIYGPVEVMTAFTYLTRYQPETLALLLDPRAALITDAERAAQLCRKLGFRDPPRVVETEGPCAGLDTVAVSRGAWSQLYP